MNCFFLKKARDIYIYKFRQENQPIFTEYVLSPLNKISLPVLFIFFFYLTFDELRINYLKELSDVYLSLTMHIISSLLNNKTEKRRKMYIVFSNFSSKE